MSVNSEIGNSKAVHCHSKRKNMTGLVLLNPHYSHHLYAHLHRHACTNCHRVQALLKYYGSKAVQLRSSQAYCHFQCHFYFKSRSINTKTNNDRRIHWPALLFIVFWLIISLSSHCNCLVPSSLLLNKIPTSDKLLLFEPDGKLTKYINQLNKINTKIIPNKMKLFKQANFAGPSVIELKWTKSARKASMHAPNFASVTETDRPEKSFSNDPNSSTNNYLFNNQNWKERKRMLRNQIGDPFLTDQHRLDNDDGSNYYANMTDARPIPFEHFDPALAIVNYFQPTKIGNSDNRFIDSRQSNHFSNYYGHHNYRLLSRKPKKYPFFVYRRALLKLPFLIFNQIKKQQLSNSKTNPFSQLFDKRIAINPFLLFNFTLPPSINGSKSYQPNNNEPYPHDHNQHSITNYSDSLFNRPVRDQRQSSYFDPMAGLDQFKIHFPPSVWIQEPTTRFKQSKNQRNKRLRVPFNAINNDNENNFIATHNIQSNQINRSFQQSTGNADNTEPGLIRNNLNNKPNDNRRFYYEPINRALLQQTTNFRANKTKNRNRSKGNKNRGKGNRQRTKSANDNQDMATYQQVWTQSAGQHKLPSEMLSKWRLGIWPNETSTMILHETSKQTLSPEMVAGTKKPVYGITKNRLQRHLGPSSIGKTKLYDVPQIECPSSENGMDRFACPTRDQFGRFLCIDDQHICDGYIDCPHGEDEERTNCMFYKSTKAHLDVLADYLLQWARRQQNPLP